MESRYTYDECKKLAHNCKGRGHMAKLYHQAYNICRANGWLDEFFGKAQVKNNWTYENCKNAAVSCKNRLDFAKKFKAAYNASVSNGWLNDFFGIEKNVSKYTYDVCKEIASKYKNRGDFSRCESQAYYISRKNNWLNEFFGVEKNIRKYTYEVCYFIAKECKTRIQFEKQNPCAYRMSRQKGWINDYTWFKKHLFRAELDISGLCMDMGIEFIHDKPTEWSNNLRMDFIIPSKNIIIECQGIQHFKPVEYWGGQEGLKYCQKRDRKKKRLCEKNGMRIVYYANYQYDFPYKVFTNIEEIRKILS